MDKASVTPEMSAAYVAWEPPAPVELKMPRVLGLLRAAFFAGWKARSLHGAPVGAVEAMTEFCERVERGEIRSRRTYAKFCEILDRVPQTR